jgi:hypothetical protein
VRTRRLEDLVRHWRNLLQVADAETVPADALRGSLAALDQAIASGNVNEMSARLDEVRRNGLVVEQLVRDSPPQADDGSRPH